MWIKEGKRIIRKSYGNYSNLVESREGDLIMTKSWRPPGWEEIRKEYCVSTESPDGGGCYEDDFTAGFECGADAMLKALRGRKGQTDNPWDYIPDDEEVTNE